MTSSPASPTSPVWHPAAEPVRLVLVAAQFLTRLPVPQIPVVDGDLRRATAAFPLVGAVVGALTAAAWLLAHLVLGPLPAAVTAVAVAAAVTGAFHEDGLADTFDGLWGGWEPARRLEIMRDSRIGTYGTVALLSAVLAQVALLVDLQPRQAIAALVAAHVLSRAMILVQIRMLPAVRDQGSGARVAEPIAGVGLVVAVAVTAVVLGVTAGRHAPVPVAAALVAVAAFRRAARIKLGGLSGDVLGATQQAAHVATLAAFAGLARAGWW